MAKALTPAADAAPAPVPPAGAQLAAAATPATPAARRITLLSRVDDGALHEAGEEMLLPVPQAAALVDAGAAVWAD